MPTRKGSKNAPKNGEVKPGWGDVVKASAEGAKPVQTSLLAGSEVITVIESHEVQVPVSEDEARLLNAKSTEATAKAATKEAERKRLKETLLDPLEAEAKLLRKEADGAAKEAAERKRTVQQNVRVEYHLATATVRFYDPETGSKVMLDRAMTPAEMTRLGEAPPAVPPPPADAPVVDEEDDEP